MFSATLSNKDIRDLEKAISGTKRKVKKELAIAVNKSAKKTKTEISREIRKDLAAKAKGVNRTIEVEKKAHRSEREPHAAVVLYRSRRIPLKDFKPRQTAKGVSYKISKSGGRGMVPGAFMGPRPGVTNPKWQGHVFKRVGRARLPIVKLRGPSPWGVFRKNNLRKPSQKKAAEELLKQLKARARFITLEKLGQI